MIKTKEELKYFLEEDRKELGVKRKYPRIFGDEIWKYEIILRHREYHQNQNTGVYHKIMKNIFSLLHHKMSVKLGIQISPNVCDAGLHINHYGLLVVSEKAKIGKNFNVHQGVNIGVNIDPDKAPVIGNNVFVGPGVKIYGDVVIADNIAIAAGSVVTKSFLEPNITIGGVPARILNKNKGNPFTQEV